MGLFGTTVVLAFAIVYGAGSVGAGPTSRLLEGFTLDEVLSGKFYAESFNGTWISGEFLFNKRKSLFSRAVKKTNRHTFLTCFVAKQKSYQAKT